MSKNYRKNPDCGSQKYAKPSRTGRILCFGLTWTHFKNGWKSTIATNKTNLGSRMNSRVRKISKMRKISKIRKLREISKMRKLREISKMRKLRSKFQKVPDSYINIVFFPYIYTIYTYSIYSPAPTRSSGRIRGTLVSWNKIWININWLEGLAPLWILGTLLSLALRQIFTDFG